ncbi:MAG: lipid-A-disaccharide synthase [Pseudarcicella sp.]|nr:lipid-A-disaccharide synthase [Pseudarcicella sp.]
MKYYIIAGERSGDLHGSNLVKNITKNDPNAIFRGFGGDKMANEGVTISKHYEKLAFMGFTEVAKNIKTILGILKFCKKDILDFQPDVVILIDYAGFNMKIAKFAKSENIKTYYYIAPKVWAWNQKRALKIKQYVDHLFVIFPFEVDFFKKYNYEVDYVGNPIMDAIDNFIPNPNFKSQNNLSTKPIIALLPGSRKQELQYLLHTMLAQVRLFPDFEFVVAGVSNFDYEFYEKIGQQKNIKIVYDDTYNLLSVAHAAIVASGTATLETMLFNVPQVVCYRGNWLSYQIFKRVIKIPFVSLVNIIADKMAVKELLQYNYTIENLKVELKKITLNNTQRNHQLTDYKAIKEKIGNKGASEKTANLIVKYLKN